MPIRRGDPDPDLESLVRQTLSFLFTDHGAQLVSSEKLPGIGNGQAFVRVNDVVIRIIQKEGSINVLAAPRHKPNDWQSIEFLLMAADPAGKFPPPPVYGSLPELSSLLKPRLSLLVEALSPDRFGLTIENSRQSARKGLIAIGPRPPIPIPIGKRVLIGAAGGIVRAVRFLIPRPKDGYAKSLPVGGDPELEGNVRREFDFLFEKCKARISSNGRLGIMDFASVTVDVGNLRIRAARDRGSVGVSIAPIFAVRYWQSLGEALVAVQPSPELPKSPPSSNFRGAGRELETNFVSLNNAFSEKQFAVTRERIREIRGQLEKTWIEDWNRNPNRLRATKV
jgi:hypothetical protein